MKPGIRTDDETDDETDDDETTARLANLDTTVGWGSDNQGDNEEAEEGNCAQPSQEIGHHRQGEWRNWETRLLR